MTLSPRHPQSLAPRPQALSKRERDRQARAAHSTRQSKRGHWLGTTRRITGALTVVATGMAVSIYLMTAQTQQRWSQQYATLDRLQQFERQSLLNNEGVSRSLRDSAASRNMVPLDAGRIVQLPALLPQSQESRMHFQIDPELFSRFPVGY